ncbi:MAG: hypothetical protein ACI3ZQ_00410 [Candidatus Cryptobacteroides sp.]
MIIERTRQVGKSYTIRSRTLASPASVAYLIVWDFLNVISLNLKNNVIVFAM